MPLPRNGLAVLKKSITLGQIMLREYSNTKRPQPLHDWVFALYAKLLASARSMVILVTSKHLSDCPLIFRSICDVATDIEYILSKWNDPAESRRLCRLLAIESATDSYELLEAHRSTSHLTSSQFLKRHPEYKPISEYYDWAKKQPEFTNQRAGPKRWSRISGLEKREVLLESGKYLKITDFLTSSLGNASAHSRPLLVKQFMIRPSQDVVRYKLNPTPPFLGGNEWCGYAAISVLCIAGTLAEAFHLRIALRLRIAMLGMTLDQEGFQESCERCREDHEKE